MEQGSDPCRLPQSPALRQPSYRPGRGRTLLLSEAARRSLARRNRPARRTAPGAKPTESGQASRPRARPPWSGPRPPRKELRCVSYFGRSFRADRLAAVAGEGDRAVASVV